MRGPAIAAAFVVVAWLATSWTLAAAMSTAEALTLREEVRGMFYHGFNGYMRYAFPRDELLPLSCTGVDTLGGYSLTLVDSLDTLALLGDKDEFSRAVMWLSHNLRFDRNATVSVFETNIRVLGGLLSAHILASDAATGMRVEGYEGQLLTLAADLGQRLLRAFETPTGIPYGSVNLLHGVPHGETPITSTAGGGTMLLELGMLSRLTGNTAFETAARRASRGLWSRRSRLGLVGAHIDVRTGEWTHRDAGIGTSVDSFYEYLIKGHVLLGDHEYLHTFRQAYKAVAGHLHRDPWYVEVNMHSGVLVWPLFNSLQAFWPGLQVLAGDVEPAVRTHRAFSSVLRHFGFTPEGFNLATFTVQPGQKGHPLRPELAESAYLLYTATQDPEYLEVGRAIVSSLQTRAKSRCGYAALLDVETHEQVDHMESFFLAETVKYLWLLFDGKGRLCTEGHYFPITNRTAWITAPDVCPSARASPPAVRMDYAENANMRPGKCSRLSYARQLTIEARLASCLVGRTKVLAQRQVWVLYDLSDSEFIVYVRTPIYRLRDSEGSEATIHENPLAKEMEEAAARAAAETSGSLRIQLKDGQIIVLSDTSSRSNSATLEVIQGILQDQAFTAHLNAAAQKSHDTQTQDATNIHQQPPMFIYINEQDVDRPTGHGEKRPRVCPNKPAWPPV
eukprot:jgi/Chlat1/6695/Chrsp49S00478